MIDKIRCWLLQKNFLDFKKSFLAYIADTTGNGLHKDFYNIKSENCKFNWEASIWGHWVYLELNWNYKLAE